MEASVFLHPFAILLVFRFSAATEAHELIGMRHHCLMLTISIYRCYLFFFGLSFLDNTVIHFMQQTDTGNSYVSNEEKSRGQRGTLNVWSVTTQPHPVQCGVQVIWIDLHPQLYKSPLIPFFNDPTRFMCAKAPKEDSNGGRLGLIFTYESVYKSSIIQRGIQGVTITNY